MHLIRVCLLLGLLGLGLSAAPAAVAQPPSPPRGGQAKPTAAAVALPLLDEKSLAHLRLEQSRLLDNLAAIQARLALLEQQVFSSHLLVRLDVDSDSAYQLARLVLEIDGAPVTTRGFERPPAIQTLTLFDGYLEPGPHSLALRLRARGPDDSKQGPPGYFGGSGLLVHLRQKASCQAVFKVDLDGNSEAELRREAEPEAEWSVGITASYQTEAGQ